VSKPYIVVVRQLGGVGDVLSMSCVYRGLREKYKHHKICLVTAKVYLSAALTDLAEHNPFIDEMHIFEPYDGTTQRTKDVWYKYYRDCPNLEDDLWYQRADLRIDLNTACVDYEWDAMHSPGGIQKPRYQIWCDHAEVVPSTYFPIYNITRAEKKMAQAYYADQGLDPKRCILVGATACDKKRAMGIGRLGELCKGITAMGFTPMIVDPTFRFENYPAINGKRVSDLMAIIAEARLAVSVDSGILHMAGATHVPVVGIFGPTDHAMRMQLYQGSAIESRRMMPCAPCWYDYPCLKDPNPARHFECVNKVSSGIILEEVRRWVARTD
jgi:hypothetical protein